MKAAIYTQYGPPEIVKIGELPLQVPNDNEVRIKVHYSTVNRTDCGFRSAEYFIVRFWSGLLKPKNPVLGCEFSGEIESTGKNVTLFKTGDKVFGYSDTRFGSHAEFMLMDENAPIVKMPENMGFEEAAAMTEGSHYALCDIRAAKIGAGQNILVNGATGAIGSAAVQIVKSMGCTVTAVCETRHMELVKSLGAGKVVDYTKEDFTKTNDRFDVVFDAVGKSTFGKCKPLLKDKGIYVSTELGPYSQNPFLALITPLFGGKKIIFPIPTMKKEDAEYLKDLFVNGKFKPVLDRTYPLEQISEAYTYVESGMKTGNVLIKIK